MIINETLWHALENRYEHNFNIKCNNFNEEEICLAEKEIGDMFSDFYRYFLKHHYVKSLGSWIMYPLYDRNDSAIINHKSVVQATRIFRRNIQIPYDYRKWYIIGCNSYEDENLLAMNKRREVWVLHRYGIAGADKVANDFERFIYESLQEPVEAIHALINVS